MDSLLLGISFFFFFSCGREMACTQMSLQEATYACHIYSLEATFLCNLDRPSYLLKVTALESMPYTILCTIVDDDNGELEVQFNLYR